MKPEKYMISTVKELKMAKRILRHSERKKKEVNTDWLLLREVQGHIRYTTFRSFLFKLEQAGLISFMWIEEKDEEWEKIESIFRVAYEERLRSEIDRASSSEDT